MLYYVKQKALHAKNACGKVRNAIKTGVLKGWSGLLFEKNLELGYLLDFYGELLSDHRREAMNCYYNDDMSLAEIAAVLGITRQGVRDLIKKAGDELMFYEEKLGLARRFRDIESLADDARALIGRGDDDHLRAVIDRITETVG